MGWGVAPLALGNGSGVTAPDTVPLCVWIAAHHLDNYEEALWQAVAARGDCDTTCAIVGGVIAAGSPRNSVPEEFRGRREALPPLHEPSHALL